MRITIRRALVIGAASVVLLAAVPKMTTLSGLADHGYAVSWLGLEDAVEIAGHGAVYTVHLGSRYVSDGVGEIVIDAPPVLVDGHVEVPDSFVRKLVAADRSAHASFAPAVAAPVSGALTIHVNFQSGSEALVVAGTAPAAVPITLTISATLDPDIPQVVVDRTDVTADSSGHFSVVVPYAAAFEHTAVLSVAATSIAGVSPASLCCLRVSGARSFPSTSH